MAADGETIIINYDAGITASDAIETADGQGQIPGPADLTAADRARRERHDLPAGQRQSLQKVIDIMQFAGRKTQAFSKSPGPGSPLPVRAASGDGHQRGWRSRPTSRVATRGA
jgi:hypothetical protein